MITPRAAKVGAAILGALTDRGWHVRRVTVDDDGRVRLAVTGWERANPLEVRMVAAAARRHLSDLVVDVAPYRRSVGRFPRLRWTLDRAVYAGDVTVIPHDPVPDKLVERAAAAVQAVSA